MVYRLLFVLIPILLTISCKAPTELVVPEGISYTDVINQSLTFCEKNLKQYNYPGLAVAVGKGGKELWAMGFGYADVENQYDIDPRESLFRIGSISKTLTAVALQRLVQEDKIDLKEKVQTYVSYFPEKKHALSVEQVAGHIAGVRHYSSPMEMMSNVYYPTVKGGMEIFMQDTLLYKPGDKYSYSSYGWNLISAIIEETAETPFLEYMQSKVFDPFGLSKTQPEVRSALPDNLVKFYIQSMGLNSLAPAVDNSYKWAGGGFISTATDLLKFSHSVHHSEIIDDQVLDRFQTPLMLNNGKKTNYGLGWSTNTDKKGRRWVGHSGGSVGGTSMYLYYPDYDLTVITLVNQSSAKMDQLAWRIAEQFITQIDSQNN